MKKEAPIMIIRPNIWEIVIGIFLAVASLLMIIFDIRPFIEYKYYQHELILILSVIELIRRSTSYAICPDMIRVRVLQIPIRRIPWKKINSASYFPQKSVSVHGKEDKENAKVFLTFFPGIPFFGGAYNLKDFRRKHIRHSILIRIPKVNQEQTVSVLQNRLDAYGVKLKIHTHT